MTIIFIVKIVKKNYYYSKIKTLEKFTRLIEDILKEDKGLELLADLAFIADKEIPGANFEITNNELQKVRPIFNNNALNKFAFKCLEQYDLIEPIDYSSGKVKRLK